MESTSRQSFEPISLESFGDVEHADLQEIQKEKEETMVSSRLDSLKDSIFEETVETFKVKEQELGSEEIINLKELGSDEAELNAEKVSNLNELDFEKVSKEELDSEDSWKTETSPTKRLKWAILLCILIFIIQFIGGWISASLALTADAFHMLSDALGYMVSLTAIHFAKSKPSLRLPWGKKRFEVIGAFLSVLIMWILCVVLLVEAFDRFSNPQPIDGKAMLGMAIGGVFFNGLLIFIFGHDHENSLNRHHEEGKSESEEKNLFLHKSFLEKNQWKLDSSFDQSLQNSLLEKNQFSKNEIEKSSFQEIALSTDTPFSFDPSTNPLSVSSKDINIRVRFMIISFLTSLGCNASCHRRPALFIGCLYFSSCHCFRSHTLMGRPSLYLFLFYCIPYNHHSHFI